MTVVGGRESDARLQLPQFADLPVLLRDELLVERRDLDVQVVLGQEEVRGEPLDHAALLAPLEVERPGLVVPVDLVEVQQAGELALARMREPHGIALQGQGWGFCCSSHAPPARAPSRPLRRAPLAIVPSRSVHTLSTASAKTPWPLARRSTTASGDSTA